MKTNIEIMNAIIQAEAAYVKAIREVASPSPELAILERETHDALNKFLSKNTGIA